MTALFLKLLNMSIAAAWLVLAVTVLRLVLKKAPRAIVCALWALVAVRLVCPFSFESVLSLIPSAETVSQDILLDPRPTVHTGVAFIDEAVNPVLADSFAPAVGDSANPMQVVTFAAACVWLAGVVLLAAYTVFSCLRLRRKVSASLEQEENVRLCDYIDTPFILGILRPKIYLPSAMEASHRDYVLAHERAHLKRRDHWWKPLGFALLAVYWFNPVMWIAYILLCRDIELACDEKVVQNMAAEDKKAYSEALLSCSIPRRMIAACPLAFGEVGVKQRVRSVLHYKKPGFWLIVTAVAVSIAAAVCFLTDPKRSESPEVPEQTEGKALNAELMEQNLQAAAEEALQAALKETSGQKTREFVFAEAYEEALLKYYSSQVNVVWADDGTDVSTDTSGLVKVYAYVSLDEANGTMVEVYPPVHMSQEEGTVLVILLTDRTMGDSARGVVVENYLEEICANAGEADDARACIREKENIYRILMHMEEDTLYYCFGEFLKGGQDDLRGQVMAVACQDIIAQWGEADLVEDDFAGQDWFDVFRREAWWLQEEMTDEQILQEHPAAWTLIHMFDSGDYSQCSFENHDFSGVTKVVLANAYNRSSETEITDPGAVRQICGFLQGISGTDGESARGYLECKYSLVLYRDEEAVFAIAFGNSNDAVFHYGQYPDGYAVRYRLTGWTVDQIDRFLAEFDKAV